MPSETNFKNSPSAMREHLLKLANYQRFQCSPRTFRTFLNLIQAIEQNRLSVGRLGWLYSSASRPSCTPSLIPTSGVGQRHMGLSYYQQRASGYTYLLEEPHVTCSYNANCTFVQGQWKYNQRAIPKYLSCKWQDPTCFLVTLVQSDPVRA